MNKAEKSLRWVVNQIPDFKPTTNEEKMLVAIKLYSEAGAEEIKRLEAENAALRERLEKAIELPCKIGGKFYVVYDCPLEIKEKECCAFTFTEDGQVVLIDGLDCHYSLKIIYLSKEDAEARLEELELIYNDKEITSVD